MRFKHATVVVSDLPRSLDFYETLGLKRIVLEQPRYARLIFPSGDATLWLEVTGANPAPSRVQLYFECSDLDERVRALRERGIVFEMEPTDMDYLWREARLKDPDGHDIRLYRAAENRLNPPWRLQE
jgi:catechol 2,3-dioxygenase-like lactoylglutathione lyase family enzyme